MATPNAELDPAGVNNAIADLKRGLGHTDTTMRYVIIVLLFMLATSVITTGLWVIDAFISKDRKQVIYNVTVTPQQAIEMEKKALK